MRNLAELLTSRASTHPGLRIALPEGNLTLDDAVGVATDVARTLHAAFLEPGDRVALAAGNSPEYVLLWMACQLAGIETALINPHLPAPLLGEMLATLAPAAVATTGDGPAVDGWTHIQFPDLRAGQLRVDGEDRPLVTDGAPLGLDRDPLEVAGYMHTSGTSGPPKFCAQSHAYFLRLARLVADNLSLSPRDTLMTPLPLFHINPLGYGLLAAVTGGANLVCRHRFSASSFWETVTTEEVTVLVLHAPPVEILKHRPASEAAGHRVRAMFWADADFMDRFDVPVALSGYGSTEVGGLTHLHHWRRGDPSPGVEGMSRHAGYARHDIEWRLDPAGQILIRERTPGTIFSGYLGPGGLEPAVDDEGWFATGDLGRVDDDGGLVFVERATESIRSRGEHVPIAYVERAFAAVPGVDDVALWKEPGPLNDDTPVLFVVGEGVGPHELATAAADLPTFMRPTAAVWVAGLPRDDTAGKVRRRHLDQLPVLRRHELSP